MSSQDSLKPFSWPENLLGNLAKLHRFDQISVTWVDASQSSNVPFAVPKLANHAVETTVTSEGKFFAVQTGDRYNDPHILLLKDATDQEKGTFQSIPLALVKDLQIFGKIALMSKKAPDQQGLIRYSDGIVKKLLSAQESRGDILHVE